MGIDAQGEHESSPIVPHSNWQKYQTTKTIAVPETLTKNVKNAPLFSVLNSPCSPSSTTNGQDNIYKSLYFTKQNQGLGVVHLHKDRHDSIFKKNKTDFYNKPQRRKHFVISSSQLLSSSHASYTSSTLLKKTGLHFLNINKQNISSCLKNTRRAAQYHQRKLKRRTLDFKLGLRGGTPMWGGGKSSSGTSQEAGDNKLNLNERPKKESHLSKVSILKKKSPLKGGFQSLPLGRIALLGAADCSEADDNSSTPPSTPPLMASTSQSAITPKMINVQDKKMCVPTVLSNNSPNNEKHLRLSDEIMDYDDDDDNDNTVLSTEVSLSSVAQQNDGEEITVIESLTQSDIQHVISSPLESDQIADEYLLFHGNMVVDMSEDMHSSDKEEDIEEDYNSDNMHIVIRSPTTSDDEYIVQNKSKKYSIVPNFSPALKVIESSQQQLEKTPDLKIKENATISSNLDAIIAATASNKNITTKLADEQISTTEDFEELIDERSRKEKIIKPTISSAKHIAEIHKYAAPKQQSLRTFQAAPQEISFLKMQQQQNDKHQQLLLLKQQQQQSSSIPVLQTRLDSSTTIMSSSDISKHSDIKIITSSPATSNKLTSIILHNAPIRNNVISIPKLVSNTSSAGFTILNASTPQMARFTVPLISANAVRQLPNVKVIDKPSSSLSLTRNSCLPKNIFDDDQSDSYEEETKSNSDEKGSKSDSESSNKSKNDDLPDYLTKFNDDILKQSSVIINSSNKGSKTFIKDDEKRDCSTPPVYIDRKAKELKHTTENIQLSSNTFVMDESKRTPPFISSASTSTTSVVIHHKHSTPELKMTAQVIQEKQPVIQITGRTEVMDDFNLGNSADDTKSVVISIPSPTPSQEQMLDNIAMQALEKRRRDGEDISREFDSFEDVLDMIENITGEQPTVLEDTAAKIETKNEPTNLIVEPPKSIVPKRVMVEESVPEKKKFANSARSSMIIPQLSPLSQPGELTSNMANVSQQLRSLLSSLQTTTSASTNQEVKVKNVANRVVTTPTASISSKSPVIRAIAEDNNKSVVSTSAIHNISKTSSDSCYSHSTIPSTISSTIPVTFTTSNFLLNRAGGGIHLMPDHPKLPPVTTTVTQNHTSNVLAPPLKNITTSESPTTSISLATMLKSHHTPLVVENAPLKIGSSETLHGLITTTTTSSAISIISSSSNNSTSTENIAPLVIFRPQLVNSSSCTNVTPSSSSLQQSKLHTSLTSSVSGITSSSEYKSVISNTNLLQAHLTKTMQPSSSILDNNASLINKQDEIKHEILESIADITEKNLIPATIPNAVIKREIGESYSSTHLVSSSSSVTPLITSIINSKGAEDSQNVLLKKLLQNTACANTQTPLTTNISGATLTTTNAAIKQTIESVVTAASSEPEIIKNNPTLSALLPIKSEPSSPIITTKHIQKTPLVSRETSFVSNPPPSQQLHHHLHQPPQLQQIMMMNNNTTNSTTTIIPDLAMTTTTTTTTLISPQQHQQQQQLHIEIKKSLPPSRSASRDELLSPLTPKSSCSQDSNLETPPLIIKKEIIQQPPMQDCSPSVHTHEIKKEFMDESSQNSEISDHSRSELLQLKEEDTTYDTEKLLLEKEVLKKQKRRMYQQKRRQNQILNKELAGQPKKRPRKSSKVEDDYDTYVDSVLVQLRSFPAINVIEPPLFTNFTVIPVHGSGDLSKVGTKEYDSRYGDLIGCYGNSSVPGYSNYYNTKPFGDQELVKKKQLTTQREFYDQEFPLIKFETEEDKKIDLFCREDSPDSIVSDSCSESSLVPEQNCRFLGIKHIEADSDEEFSPCKGRNSPIIPIIIPIPVKLKPTGSYIKEFTDMNKENISTEKKPSTPTPPKASGNVTVTITLTSSAAEDIMGILKDIANILHIPAPTSYQIIERTSTPPSQKLGLYRTKGKDGKEGDPIDIQSILNGTAKFCKHCDVVILNNLVRKKVSELPFLCKDSGDALNEDDELFFCSSSCYMQYSLMHRSPTITEAKALAIIDHLCHKDKVGVKRKRSPSELYEQKKPYPQNQQENKFFKKNYDYNQQLSLPPDAKIQCTEAAKQKYLFDEGGNISTTTQPKIYKGTRYKLWTPSSLQSPVKYRRPSDKDIIELFYRLQITVSPTKMPEDTRKCIFCQGIGDGVADGPARLLNFDVDKWVHLNCGLWSDGVYETVNGALMNLENALQQSLASACVICNKYGATIRCFKTRCTNVYHLNCAVKDNCVFFKNKTTYCAVHVPKNEKDNELTTLSVSRRVYINRDENRQVAAIMHHSDNNNLLRVGSLIFLSVGQLLPHQLQNFHTSNFIYPIGYKIIRFYWSMRKYNKRCRYICSIHDNGGRPEFRVLIQEPPEEDMEYKNTSPKAVWDEILENIANMRKKHQCIQFFNKFVSGEDLFGLTEPAVVRVLESLPGIETLTDYKFKYGRNPLLELPLAINPSGAARSEPRLKNHMHWKRPVQRTSGTNRPLFNLTPPPVTANNLLGEMTCPYSKQFVHSKSSQYKKMKQEWRNNVFLARSKIQGLGLYAARDLEKHTMVIEYIGEIIRTELAETREKQHEAKNRGIYMFRLDEERVVDATLCGGLARYINHSCNPNCVAETVEVDRDVRIIIFAKRRIQRGEELAYDYKFDIEDDQNKISCMCGAPNCRKWMN